jgi:hypothetical protein
MLRREIDERPAVSASGESYSDGQNGPPAVSGRGTGLETAAKFLEERCAL